MHATCTLINQEVLDILEQPPIDTVALATFFGHLRACQICQTNHPDLFNKLPESPPPAR